MKTVLVKIRVDKNDKLYWDILLCWRVDNKLMSVRVAPQFPKDYRFLVAHALTVEGYEVLEKYV